LLNKSIGCRGEHGTRGEGYCLKVEQDAIANADARGARFAPWEYHGYSTRHNIRLFIWERKGLI